MRDGPPTWKLVEGTDYDDKSSDRNPNVIVKTFRISEFLVNLPLCIYTTYTFISTAYIKKTVIH